MRIVDVHAHFYPRPYLELLDRVTAGDSSAWARAARTLLETRFKPDPRMVNIDAHIEDMDRAGVEVEALSLSTPMCYFDEERDAVSAARMFNDSLAEICVRFPKRFKALASLPLPHVDAALKELDRAINTLGLHGVGLGANVRRRYQLDDERFLPIYREINRLKLTIFLHPAIPPGLEEMLDYDLWVSPGFYIDSALATLRLARRGVFDENPDLHFIVPHLGTYLLSAWDRIGAGTRPPLPGQPPRRSIGDVLRRLYYDSVNTHLPFWKCAIDTVGTTQIVFGTDYPFGSADSVARMIKQIEGLPISAAEREAIFSGTADRILRQ